MKIHPKKSNHCPVDQSILQIFVYKQKEPNYIHNNDILNFNVNYFILFINFRFYLWLWFN